MTCNYLSRKRKDSAKMNQLREVMITLSHLEMGGTNINKQKMNDFFNEGIGK
jgi:hypothetical protein